MHASLFCLLIHKRIPPLQQRAGKGLTAGGDVEFSGFPAEGDGGAFAGPEGPVGFPVVFFAVAEDDRAAGGGDACAAAVGGGEVGFAVVKFGQVEFGCGLTPADTEISARRSGRQLRALFFRSAENPQVTSSPAQAS